MENGNLAPASAGRPKGGWLPANVDHFEGAAGAAGTTGAQATNAHAESAHAESAHAESAHAESAHAESAHAPQPWTAPAIDPRPAVTTASGPRRGLRRSVVIGAVLLASVAGGVVGSAATAVAIERGAIPGLAAQRTITLGSAPAVVRTSVSAASPEGSLAALYKQVGPAVVSIETAVAAQRGTSSFPDIPGFPGAPRAPRGQGQAPNGAGALVPEGEGTGFVIDGDGHILTNNHVVEGADRLTVVLADGTRIQAQVVGTDPESDVALLKAALPAGKVGIATLGDSSAVQPGDTAVAIGTPFGLDHTLTAGIISAVNRDFGTAAGRPMRGLLQTDAPINPGNSGGPLLNAQGEVIGITTSIESPVRGSVGIGFAIPINQAKDILPALSAGQKVQHAWLGISGVTVTPDVAQTAGLPSSVNQGVLIAQVAPDSPATKAGLRGGSGTSADPTVAPKGGDVILAVDGHQIRMVQELSTYLDGKHPGDTVTISIWRDGSRQDVKVTLGAWPAPQQAQQS